MSTSARVLILASPDVPVEAIKQALVGLKMNVSNRPLLAVLQSPGAIESQKFDDDDIVLVQATDQTISVELIRQLRQADIASTLIVLVGNADHRFTVEAIKAGANDLLVTSEVGRLSEVILRENFESMVNRQVSLIDSDFELLANIVHSTEDAVIGADLAGTIHSWNPAATAMYGWSAVEAIGKNISIAVPEERMTEFNSIITRASAGESVRLFETSRKRKDGSQIVVSLTTSPIRDRSGEIIGYCKITRDITAQRQARDALIRDAQILANLRDAVITADLDGFITHWNDGASQLLGWSAEERLGRSLIELAPPESRIDREKLLQLLKAGYEWDGEFEDLRKDGSQVWVSARLRNYHDALGNRIGFLCVCNDISSRKQAETERDRLLSHLQIQIERMPIAYIAYDSEINYVDWNPAAERIFGYTKDEIIGQPLLKLVHPDDREAVKHISVRLQAGEVAAHSLNRNVTKDGRVIICEWHNTPLFDANGKFTGVLSMTIDVTERVRGEKALRESEERLRLALSAGRMGTFDWDIVTNEIVWSDTHYELFGYPLGDRFPVRFHHFADRIHPEDLPRVEQAINAAMEKHSPYANEARIILPDGSIRWVMGAGEFYYGSDHKPLRMLGTLVDITPRKQAEEALKASDAQFRAFMDNMPAGAWVLDEESRVVFVNRFYGEMAGVDPSWLIGKTANDLYDPDIAAKHQANDRLVLERNAPVETTEEYTRPDGAAGVVLSVKFPLGKRDGRRLMGGVAIEITERARMQSELMMRDRAIQAVPQGILITDATKADHPIVYVSPGFEQLTGYAASETMGRNCRFLRGVGTDQAEIDRLREALQNQKTFVGVLLNYRKDGTPFWNELSISPVFDGNGRLVRHVGVQTDVTGRRLLEEQLRQAQKMEAIGQLAGGVAHDFNNLLTVINGFSELAYGDTEPDDPLREPLAEIRDAGERAAGLTQQLLAFSRQAIIAPQVLDLNEVIESVSKMLRRLIRENISVESNLAQVPCRILIDPGQMEQVIINLAVNARDAMPTGGKLTIATELEEKIAASGDCAPGRYVKLTVSDTGTGMTEEVVARIFEPFFTTKSLGQGTGLGLAMVYGIVKQSGGHLFVESQLGLGSKFILYFPYFEASFESKKDLDATIPPSPGCETILLAEDEDGVRRLAKIALESLGYQVLATFSGNEARYVAATHEGPIDLLVTDVVMPEMGGRELSDAVRAIRPGIKILFVSGHTDDALLRSGVESASHNFLQKPFTPSVLGKKVREVLDDLRNDTVIE